MTRSRDRSGTFGATRRRLLSGVVAAVGIGLAGCLGEDLPEPIPLDGEQSCDNCGMVIREHPGPVGQTYFAGDVPEGRDGPAWFCSSKCTYSYTFDREDEGSEVQVTYLTDYSGVDYEIEGDADSLVISAHLEAEAFADAADLVCVAGSDVEGAMGSALIPFSDVDDAEAFALEYGGETVPHGEVTRDLLAGL